MTKEKHSTAQPGLGPLPCNCFPYNSRGCREASWTAVHGGRQVSSMKLFVEATPAKRAELMAGVLMSELAPALAAAAV